MNPPVSPLPQVGDELNRLDPHYTGPIKRKYTVQNVIRDNGQYVVLLKREDREHTIPWVVFDTFWTEWERQGPYSDGLENWV